MKGEGKGENMRRRMKIARVSRGERREKTRGTVED